MLKSHNEVVKMYVDRDNNMKLDCVECILFSIKKLGYYNLNVSYELDKRVRTKFDQLNIKDLSYNGYKKAFETTEEYNGMVKNISHMIERSVKLAKYIGTNLNEEFYSNCTLDELMYLGY